ncbi:MULTISPECIES: tetratricopeptide repeat protein [Thiorhodovibrio]|uniref:tetratricopeptide repeat protein n=1 Tax=Thiorhodovibrio TaxID=61593 RepID=UPI0019137801|nr:MULTISPECIES: tetratricopeptide repeat protein [Thiorhodovibrio]MBK5969058.1 hypothetical protein [Thiorhodovibrio winogradskyi]WPL15060.1 TPR repeat-containing protein YrrB [Thiorhodovibrio litoralis]
MSAADKSLPGGQNTEARPLDALIAAYRRREYARVVPLARALLKAQPGQCFVWKLLGLALAALGEHESALEAKEQAVRCAPEDGEAHSNLCNTLRQLGRLEEAERHGRRAVALAPGLAMAHANLSAVLLRQSQAREAAHFARQALALQADMPEAKANLAAALLQLGGHREAQRLYRELVTAAPGYAAAWRGLAFAHNHLGFEDEALGAWQRALSLAPEDAENWSALALAQVERGRFAEAERHYREALRRDPNKVEAWAGLVKLRRMTPEDGEWLRRAEELLGGELAVVSEIELRFAMGKFCNDVGDYQQAFAYYQSANARKRAQLPPYNREAEARLAERLIRLHRPEQLNAVRPGASDSRRAVFIIGMPRSGTSLTEQMLASHPEVLGAGELGYWREAANAHPAAFQDGAYSDALLRQLAEGYLQELAFRARARPNARYVIDKMPGNVWHLGLIAAVFPHARFVHVTRDPRDTCLSIYCQNFDQTHLYASDLEDLAWHYRLYHRLMTHWHAVLPARRLLAVPYEGLVDDPEGWARRLLAFLELPWDARVLAHEQTERRVGTASNWQARQPIYKTSKERWRRYGDCLEPLMGLQGLAGFTGETAAESVTNPPEPPLGSSSPGSSPAATARFSERWRAQRQKKKHHKRARAANKSVAGVTAGLAGLFNAALQAQQRGALEEAVRGYDEVLAVRADLTPAHNNRAAALRELGRFEEALAACNQALAREPGYVEAHCNRGNALQDLGRMEEALGAYEQALRPSYDEAHSNRGAVLWKLGRPRDALQACDRALALNPGYLEAHYNRANALQDLGLLEQALGAYDQVLALNPGYVAAHQNRAMALRKLGRLAEALQGCERALALKPDAAEVLGGRGVVLQEMGRLEEALGAYEQVMRMQPGAPEAPMNKANILRDLGRLTEALEAYDQALAVKPDYADAHSNRLLLRHYFEAVTPATLLAEAGRFNQCLTRVLPALQLRRSAGRRLRVGYVSGDLCQHPVAFFLEALLAWQDRSRLETLAYSTDVREDAVTARLRERFDGWRSLVGWADAEAAEAIRADEVDILIDLSGHTAHHRLGVFAQRAAPVQVTWLGYFGTTGVSEMDYLLGDPYVTPAGEEDHFSERVWRLPESYLCFSAPQEAPAVAALPARGAGTVTFGNFNNLAKMTERVVAVWARILHALPNARLFLKTKQLADPSAVAQARARFAAHGIGPERLRLEGPAPRAELLAAYAQVDIALDPFPYPGGTTSCEALWMGVPVLTKRGDRFLSHVGESIAHNAGLPEWIAADDADYVAKAVAFAADLDALAALRARLREQVAASPLFDAPRFARHFEAALRGMWDETMTRSAG